MKNIIKIVTLASIFCMITITANGQRSSYQQDFANKVQKLKTSIDPNFESIINRILQYYAVVDFTDWMIYDVEENGNSFPLASIQTLVTIRWRTWSFEGWNPYDLYLLYSLHFSHQLKPWFSTVEVNLPFHTDDMVWKYDAPQDIVLRADGTIQTSYYIHLQVPLKVKNSNQYPDDYFGTNIPISIQNTGARRKWNMICARRNLNSRCDYGKEVGLTNDKKWQWSIQLSDYKFTTSYLRLKIKLQRTTDMVNDPSDDEDAETTPYWHSWINEGKIPFFLGLLVAIQYLIPVFLRERFLFGLINTILFSMCLEHYDSLPALQLVDSCPWLTYSIIMFYLQIFALIWFSIRAFVCYNSSLLTQLPTNLLDYSIIRGILTIGLVNDSHGESICRDLMLLESSQSINVETISSLQTELDRERETSLRDVATTSEGSSTTTTTTTIAKQIAEQLKQSTKSCGDGNLAEFYLLSLALDRILFVINMIIWVSASATYA